jgi:hypothetical protein
MGRALVFTVSKTLTLTPIQLSWKRTANHFSIESVKFLEFQAQAVGGQLTINGQQHRLADSVRVSTN